MLFDNFADAQATLLWSTFVIALVLGLVANKTNFCTMGAVSDWVNMGDTGRLRAWLFAMAVAMIGVALLEAQGWLRIDEAFPPYRGSQLIWAENILGGFMFGIGMTLASGCGNKTLVRIGGGNLKSVWVFLVIAVVAYFMVNPFPGTDKTLMSELFYGWIRPLAVDLGSSQDIGALMGGEENTANARLVMGVLLGLALVVFVFRSADFRSRFDNVLGGLVVGLVVLAAWYVSSVIMVDVDDETYTLRAYIQEWDFIAEDAEGRPADSRPWSPQSFTFINPLGQTLGYALNKFSADYLTFGIMAVAGVVLGSLLWALISRSFRIEWFASGRDFINHSIGGVLMGLGGVLGLGCTIGQGVTGISTLALGSFLAFFGIVFGSALTMKVQYYRLVYEEEATFFKALVAALADMRLMPAAWRKLDAI